MLARRATIVPATRSPRRWKRDESAIETTPTRYPTGSRSAARRRLRSAAARQPIGRPDVVTTRRPSAIFPGERPQTRLPDDEVDPLRGEEREEDEADARLRRAAELAGSHSIAPVAARSTRAPSRATRAVAEEEIEHVRERAPRGAGDAIVEDDVLGRLDRDVGVERRAARRVIAGRTIVIVTLLAQRGCRACLAGPSRRPSSAAGRS